MNDFLRKVFCRHRWEWWSNFSDAAFQARNHKPKMVLLFLDDRSAWFCPKCHKTEVRMKPFYGKE